MTNSQLKYCKDKLSQRLLTITLILSVFAFSGYSNNSAFSNTQKVQTELVYLRSTKPDKHAFAFKKLLCIPHKNIFFNNLTKYNSVLLLTYNKLVKVELDNISKLYHSIESADRFLQLKNIQDNSSKDVFISIG